MSKDPEKRFVFDSEDERQDYHDKGSHVAHRLGKMMHLPLIVYENKMLLVVAFSLAGAANYETIGYWIKLLAGMIK